MTTETKNKLETKEQSHALSNPRLNLTVEELLQMTGAVPFVLGRYRGCPGLKVSKKLDKDTGRAYETYYTTHCLEVQADGLFDQLRIIESFEKDQPGYQSPYRRDGVYLFPISRYVPEKGGKVIAMPRGVRAVELK